MSTYINIEKQNALKEFKYTFEKFISKTRNKHDSIVILCIGTDRSTGDSLAPLVGHKLQNLKQDSIYIYGSLHDTVHGKNLVETIDKIKATHRNPLIVAIDACLGRMDHVGYINMWEGGLKAGTGVGKDLPKVGDISIAGIVNFSGFMDFMVLQNTKLSLVMKMADMIADGIKDVLEIKINSSDKYCFN